jgi:phosphoribosylanthranilate isomerase
MTKAKICGLSTPDGVTAALEGGAAFLGFVFFDKSPRNVGVEAAARLAAPARGAKAQTVALVVDPDDEALDRIVRILNPDLIQLHGLETPNRTQAIAQRTGKGIVKALPIATAADLAQAAAYDGLVEHLMFDAKPPADADRPGGLGAAFDWTILAGAKFQKPHFLAGGLDPWNLSEAVRQSGAPLVDVSSGVERGPGLKDPALITAFLEAVARV